MVNRWRSIVHYPAISSCRSHWAREEVYVGPGCGLKRSRPKLEQDMLELECLIDLGIIDGTFRLCGLY